MMTKMRQLRKTRYSTSRQPGIREQRSAPCCSFNTLLLARDVRVQRLIWPCRQMMNLLTAEQQSRFEAFRRSSLNKRNMKRVCCREDMSLCWMAQSSWPELLAAASGGPFLGSAHRARAAVQLQQTAVGQQVHTNLVIAMCGIAKVFVGELIETGVRSNVLLCRPGILTT